MAGTMGPSSIGENLGLDLEDRGEGIAHEHRCLPKEIRFEVDSCV